MGELTIRVYETVMLSAEKFDRYGQISIPHKDNIKLGDEYFYQSSTIYLIKGNPELVEYHYEIYRRFDDKSLGEIINYSRRGSGMPGLWHVAAFRCPSETDADFSTSQAQPSILQKLITWSLNTLKLKV